MALSRGNMKYRALVNLALRKSPDPKSPLYGQWYDWPAGTVFEPPAHLNIKVAVTSGKIEAVKDG